MHPIVTKEKLRDEIQKKEPSSLGFVPTMGALHKGHLSLIHQSTMENELTIVSLFINPTQFNNQDDLNHYPRMLDQDLLQLTRYGKNLLIFTPTTKEIYGLEITAKKFDFMGLDQHMEGRARPNHFQGVATVVQILIDIIQPHKMYLGEKDFQQLQILRLIKRQLQWKTKIVACPIIREPHGLAMSSRNIKLSQELRIQSQSIYHSLLYAKKAIETSPINLIKRTVTNTIHRLPNLKLDYFEIVEPHTLIPISKAQKGKSYRSCIAVYAHNIRLIDNIEICC